MARGFFDIKAWQKADDLTVDVYQTTVSFPPDQRYSLTNQMQRAAVSVAANIAEGSGRSSDNEFARFVEIAYGSLMEVVSQMNIAESQEFIHQKDVADLSHQADEISRMLSGLRKNLKSTKTT